MFWESCACAWKWVIDENDNEIVVPDDAVGYNFNSFGEALKDFTGNVENPGIARAFVIFHMNMDDEGSVVLGYSSVRDDDMFRMEGL